MPAFCNRRTEIRLAARLGTQSAFLRPTIFPSAPLNMALPMPFTSARCPKADVTCFTGDGSSSLLAPQSLHPSLVQTVLASTRRRIDPESDRPSTRSRCRHSSYLQHHLRDHHGLHSLFLSLLLLLYRLGLEQESIHQVACSNRTTYVRSSDNSGTRRRIGRDRVRSSFRLQLREQFRADLPVLRLHSDKGGEFSFDLLQDFCRGEGILQSFMLPGSPQQHGIVECRIGLVMEVARTSMIHAAAPHFLWSFAVRYAAHQLNLWPRVSLPETSPTLRWKGKVGDMSVFRVWGSRAFVFDTSADKLFTRSIPCVFLGFVPDAPG
ncbi:unnamed protein product [Closterium sp. NIES-54]